MAATSTPQAKIIMLGDAAVGKTCIIQQYCDHTFDTDAEPTIGASFVAQSLATSRGAIHIHIWDTAGQERYRSLMPFYSRNAAAAIVVVDQTKQLSFESLESWIQIARSGSASPCGIYVIANKMDLPPVMSIGELKKWCRAQHFSFFQTSAKRYDTIEAVFTKIGEDLIERREVRPGGPAPSPAREGAEQSQGCC
jgi:small GTP-binding protein